MLFIRLTEKRRINCYFNFSNKQKKEVQFFYRNFNHFFIKKNLVSWSTKFHLLSSLSFSFCLSQPSWNCNEFILIIRIIFRLLCVSIIHIYRIYEILNPFSCFSLISLCLLSYLLLFFSVWGIKSDKKVTIRELMNKFIVRNTM